MGLRGGGRELPRSYAVDAGSYIIGFAGNVYRPPLGIRMIKVLLALITAVAVGIGVRGDSWDKIKNRPTPVGWMAIGLAAVVACLSIIDIQTTARLDREKDARISDLHAQLSDLQTRLKDAQEKLVTSTLLSAGFASVEISIRTSPGGQVPEGWTYTVLFQGSGRPWGFIAGSNSLLMHDSGPALDNIQVGMSFRLTETDLVPDPDKYMAPTAYIAHEHGNETSYRASASDVYIPERSAYVVQLGHRDVFGVKSVAVKITHPGALEGEVFAFNTLSISVNGAPPIELVERPNRS